MDVDWLTDSIDAAFTEFLKKTPEALKAYSDAISELKEENATGEKIPDDLLQQYDKYEAAQRELHWLLGEVKKYITMRIPEIKDEDNAGVHIQEVIIGIINKIKGGKPAKDDENGGDSVGASKLDYLSGRGKIEKAIVDNKEIATYQLQLKEYDRQAYIRLKFAWQDLAYQRATVYNRVKLNREKIDNPRRKEYGMAL